MFKGSGFYQTDYRSDSYKKAAKPTRAKARRRPTARSPESKLEVGVEGRIEAGRRVVHIVEAVPIGITPAVIPLELPWPISSAPPAASHRLGGFADDVPFCSIRCRGIDLGRWLNEAYPVPYACDEDDPPEAETEE